MRMQPLPLSNKAELRTAPTKRLDGGRLQALRLRLWEEHPFCQNCQKIVIYPDGFQLDHKTPIAEGGLNQVANLQILCHDCHANKTKIDLQRMGGLGGG